MLFRDVIKLVAIVKTTDTIGDTVEVKTKRDVFANKKSVRQNEHYQAMAQGLKPELMFEIRSIEYNKETELEFDSKPYKIIRVYDKNGEITELICEGIVANANA